MVSDYNELYVYSTDPTGSDTDHDGLSDGLEIYQYGTNAVNDTDSDDDGLSDGDEHHLYSTHPGDPDSDNDQLDDLEEVTLGADGWITDPNEADTDGDGLNDYEEIHTYGTNPCLGDTDNDTLNDYEEVHPGADGYLSDPTNSDGDGDGLEDAEETSSGTDGWITDPLNNDTDSDGLSDYDEVSSYATNPTNPDSDVDNVNDYQEVMVHATNPTDADTDGDGVLDGEEVYLGADGEITDPKNTYDPNSEVTGLSVSQQLEETHLQISWNALPGTAQYEVQYKYSGETSYHFLSLSGTSVLLTGLQAGKQYLIFVKAQSEYNNAWSQQAYAFGWTRQPQPAAPTVSVTNYVDILVSFSMNPSATVLRLYWQRGSAGKWLLYDTYTENGSVTISGCEENTLYSFKADQYVTGNNYQDSFASENSTVTTIQTQTIPEPTPENVRNFKGMSNGVNKISFSWIPPANALTGWYYKVWRKLASGGSYSLVKTTSSTSFNHYPPSTTTSYTYRIACYNNDGSRGPYSYWTGAVKSSGGGGGGPMAQPIAPSTGKIDLPNTSQTNNGRLTRKNTDKKWLTLLVLTSIWFRMMKGKMFIRRKKKKKQTVYHALNGSLSISSVKGISALILLANRYNFIRKMKVKIMRKKGERKAKKRSALLL